VKYHKKFLDYFDNRVRNFLNNCALGVKQGDPEGIHQLRVENKRLRALFRLVASINPGFDEREEFGPLRRYSKKSDQVRDCYVQIELVWTIREKLDVDAGGFIAFLKAKETEGKKELRRLVRRRNPAGVWNTKMAVSEALRDIDAERARVAVATHCEKMKNKLISLNTGSRLNDSIMHLVRILSKETWFTIQIAQQAFGLYRDADQFMASLRMVHQSLGKWHDYDLCLTLLDEFLGDTPADQVPADFVRLRKIAHNRKRYNRDRFRKAFSAFLAVAAARKA